MENGKILFQKIYKIDYESFQSYISNSDLIKKYIFQHSLNSVIMSLALF